MVSLCGCVPIVFRHDVPFLASSLHSLIRSPGLSPNHLQDKLSSSSNIQPIFPSHPIKKSSTKPCKFMNKVNFHQILNENQPKSLNMVYKFPSNPMEIPWKSHEIRDDQPMRSPPGSVKAAPNEDLEAEQARSPLVNHRKTIGKP